MCKINAQINLIPNASFEMFSSCTSGNVGYGGPCCPLVWNNPTITSPDYYNDSAVCNIIGTQFPKTGHAYAGFYAFSDDGLGSFEGREYIQIQLTDTLGVGQEYCIEFHVSLADWSTVAIAEIGAYLSDIAISSAATNNLPYTTQFTSTAGVFVTDTINWIKIKGTFTTLGGEKFITIGNFNDVNNTDTINVTNTGQRASYYYIDDVFVGKCADTTSDTINTITLPNAFSPNNDGHNDLFILQGWKNRVTEFSIMIYNRWGEKVFESNDPERAWDGTYNGKLMDVGVFAYYINATLNNGEKIIKKGNISLIR
jgi:gliding motility-associated-like protein